MLRPAPSLPVTAPLPLLITGVAGVAGYNAFHYFQSRHPGEVFGNRQVNNWPLRGEGILACDIEDREGLARLFAEHRFAAVLNCGGSCRLKSCEMDPTMAWRVNVSGVENLLDHCPADTRLVHLSVDLVYSGEGPGGYREEDPTDPVTVYGATMVAAEERILAARPDACILRISLPMGVSFNGHAGAIDWIQSRFKQSKPATLYYDELRTPTYTDCMNRLFETVLANDLAGLYHAGGSRRMSLFEIAQVINRVGGYDPSHLMGCPRLDAGPMPPRAGNVTLDSSKLTDALGYDPFDPWPYYDRHLPTGPQWHYERDPGEPGSPELIQQTLYQNPRVSEG
ncbi:SDR family oxidoreductase [Lignipirellula cremea]|uniref:dTDP-4-dehydrorhamnose reductase n=1 Tax=Lignipirellula cremea TaxID=2528010 RepID=A0A518DZG3_9BACT|nr:sugar nucleotide-binding protein [Lignipirellula cremea]QDU97237.1 dTDP-4-dehydrorhamnose reductase [Lignipirellula cremea]